MAEVLTLNAVIVEQQRGPWFIVKLFEKAKDGSDVNIRAVTSGKIKINKVKIIVGDVVKVEIPPSELPIGKNSKGRIVYRLSKFDKIE